MQTTNESREVVQSLPVPHTVIVTEGRAEQEPNSAPGKYINLVPVIKCATLMKPQVSGNSSSYLKPVLEELSEERGRHVVQYSLTVQLTVCELHKHGCAFIGVSVTGSMV